MADAVCKTENSTWSKDGIEQNGKTVRVTIGFHTYSTFIGTHKSPIAKSRPQKHSNIEWLSEFYIVNFYTGKSKRYVRFVSAVKYYHQYRQSNPHTVLYQRRKLADGSFDRSVVHYS